MTISAKEKELAAVGTSVATRPASPPRIFTWRHARLARPTLKMKQAMSDALAVRTDATQIMEAYGLAISVSLTPAPIAIEAVQGTE